MEKEVKELLKRRKELISMHVSFNHGCEKNSHDVNAIYKNGRNNVDSIIYRIDKQLMKYTKDHIIGSWLMQIKGMSVDIAAGIIAYFDVDGKDRAAQFISYAGWDNKNHPHNTYAHAIIEDLIYNFKNTNDSMYYKLWCNKYKECLESVKDSRIVNIRADRYIAKLFLSHLFEEMYIEKYNTLPKRYDDVDCIIIEPEVAYTNDLLTKA